MKKLSLEKLLYIWEQIPFENSSYRSVVTTGMYEQWLADLCERHEMLQVEVLATTMSGNQIIAVCIGEGSIRLHINAGMHANESINTNLLMAFISKLLWVLAHKDDITLSLKSFFQKFTLIFVPLINPDGVDLLNAPEALPIKVYQNAVRINNNQTDFSGWKANARGVDLNNQFPARWSQIFSLPGKQLQPAPRDFPGFAPLTEIESIAMYHLCQQYDFVSILCLHTQGEEFYWGFLDREPAFAEIFAELYEASTEYKGVRTLESYGGLKDWFILHYGRLGVTVEVGLGTNPLPVSDFDFLIQKMNQIMFSYLFFYV